MAEVRSGDTCRPGPLQGKCVGPWRRGGKMYSSPIFAHKKVYDAYLLIVK